MPKLKQIQNNAAVSGLEPGQVVRVVTTEQVGPDALTIFSVEIQAESNTGFDDGVQRAMKENCTVLKFKSAEFKSGE